ncbi:hypothetical protein JCM11251_000399 [Rhodosporidiobolus azoricus]
MAASTTPRPRRAAVQSSPYASSTAPSGSTSSASQPNKSSPSKQPTPGDAAASTSSGTNSSTGPAGKAGYTANGKKIGRPLKKGKKAAEARRKSTDRKAAAAALRLEQGGKAEEAEEGEDAEEEEDVKMEKGEEGKKDGEVDDEDDIKDNEDEAKEADDPCPACKGSKDDAVWVECDNCNKWYHWSCVSPDLTSTPENIDKWYCAPCTFTSSNTPNPLATTYKSPVPSTSSSAPSSSSGAFPLPSHLPPAPTSTPPLRKSSRSTRSRNIDYANLDAHLPASVDKWTKVIAARTAEGKVVDGFAAQAEGGGGFRRFVTGEGVKDQSWLFGDGQGGGGEGFREPFVVEKPEGLGMKMPDGRITVRDVARLVGEKTPLEVIDCASQSSLSNWNLGQWADYYEDVGGPDGRGREKVRNVISLEVSETELGGMVEAPEVVRSLDWVDQCWPADMKTPGSGEYPRVQKYCLMSVERCWTDWHVDFAGSSVFYHILRGSKTFYFIRPTAANLSAYERWSGSTERQESTWLGDSVDLVYKVELKKGETAFIPTGWIHAVYTPSDSLVIGGNFLHSLNIPTQLRIYQIELATKVPRKFRFPHFVRLLWFVAKTYHARLASHFSTTPALPLPPDLCSARVLEGLKQLSSFLIEQTTRFAKGANVSSERRRLARENIPHSKISDPVGLSREFRKVVLRAMGEEADRECFLPHVVAPVGEETNGTNGLNGAAALNGTSASGGGSAGTKRKAESSGAGGVQGEGAMLPPSSTRAKIKHASSSVNGSPAPYAALPRPASSGSRPSSSSGLAKLPTYASPSPASTGFPPSVGVSSGAAGGDIVGRQQIPLIQQTRMEERIDPSYPQYGARVAEVKESRSTQSVVRRWEVDPTPAAQGGTGGGPVVETRTVITIIERVKWTGQPGGSLRSPYPPYQPYSAVSDAQPQGQAYQPQGAGPAAMPLPPQGASTLTAQGTQQRATGQQAGGMNPAPYPSYGYPYHYNLPSSASPSSAPGPAGVQIAGPSPSTTPLQHPQYAQTNQQQQQQQPQLQQQQLSPYPPATYTPQQQQASPSPYAQPPPPGIQNAYASLPSAAPLPALPPPPPSGFAPSSSRGAMALAFDTPPQQAQQQGQGGPPFSALAGAQGGGGYAV